MANEYVGGFYGHATRAYIGAIEQVLDKGAESKEALLSLAETYESFLNEEGLQLGYFAPSEDTRLIVRLSPDTIGSEEATASLQAARAEILGDLGLTGDGRKDLSAFLRSDAATEALTNRYGEHAEEVRTKLLGYLKE